MYRLFKDTFMWDLMWLGTIKSLTENYIPANLATGLADLKQCTETAPNNFMSPKNIVN